MATWAWRCVWPERLPDRAPFFADIADGPPGGAAFWLATADGVRLRWAFWAGGSRGTVVLFPGRSEYVEKYGRTARAFHAAGFTVAALDWRGQGLSDRTAPDIGDIAHFDAYQADATAYLAALSAAGAPRPWAMLGHSMGGCIGLRALQAGAPFQSAIFSAPMWAIELPRALRPIARPLARAVCAAGWAGRYVPGGGPVNYTLAHPFEGNKWTSDRAAWAWLGDQLRARPELNTGGPSWRWLAAALDEIVRVTAAPMPAIPALTWLGEYESIVEADAVARLTRRWPGARLAEVPRGRHELLMEAPAIRGPILADTVAFIDRTAATNGQAVHAWTDLQAK
jgi:lysophospholipase